MSKILTPKQQEELNKAVLQYLEPLLKEDSSTDASSVEDALNKILNVEAESNIIPNYLEKKWSTVLRLQRRIIDLETEVKSLKLALESRPEVPAHAINGTVNGDLGPFASSSKLNWIPNVSIKNFPTQATQIVSAVQIHPKLPIIFSGCSDGALVVWSMVNDQSTSGIPEKVIKAHTRGINRIRTSLSPLDLVNKGSSSGDYLLATCSSDLSIKIWNAETYQHVRTLSGHDHTVSSIAFSIAKPTTLYSVSRDKSIKVWDLTNGICNKSYVGHSDWVRDVDVSHTPTDKTSSVGEFLLTCSNDQSIRLTHAESGTGLALLIGHSHVIERVKFLPVSSNYYVDKYLKDKHSSKFSNIPKELIENPIYTKVLGYKYCISAGRDNLLKLWLLPPPELKPHRDPMPSQYNNSQGWFLCDMVGHSSWIKSIEVHPNGKYIFSAGDDKSIKMWDLSLLASGNANCVKTLNGHNGFITDINFAPVQEEEVGESETRTKKGDETEEDVEVAHEKLMKSIESRIRCIFVSGGIDNSVRVWS
ncbi:nuclear distribution protein Pac1p [[Candida] railenensis]|uniref:Nuclear distribution protein PAC1 n=1 Tax=[Candida] railenensis TaxID=45579 RepID=A0A9P0QTQ3_9ASCO|nr:nuclear distribution protein Pac1p [[Candida] railenensis]